MCLGPHAHGPGENFFGDRNRFNINVLNNMNGNIIDDITLTIGNKHKLILYR